VNRLAPHAVARELIGLGLARKPHSAGQREAVEGPSGGTSAQCARATRTRHPGQQVTTRALQRRLQRPPWTGAGDRIRRRTRLLSGNSRDADIPRRPRPMVEPRRFIRNRRMARCQTAGGVLHNATSLGPRGFNSPISSTGRARKRFTTLFDLSRPLGERSNAPLSPCRTLARTGVQVPAPRINSAAKSGKSSS
jgi:hypothetical protein